MRALWFKKESDVWCDTRAKVEVSRGALLETNVSGETWSLNGPLKLMDEEGQRMLMLHWREERVEHEDHMHWGTEAPGVVGTKQNQGTGQMKK